MITDSERIDFLEKQFEDHKNKPYDRVCLRRSVTGRGMRLHHTKKESWGSDYATVCEAIDAAINSASLEQNV